MKNILMLLTLGFVATALSFSCEVNPQIENLNDLKKPIVVIAIKPKEHDAGFHGGYGSIILRDASGVYLTLDGNSFDGEALVASKKIGDTIK